MSLAILFGARPLTLPLFLIATGVAASYFVAMVFAPAFPGTDWIDPEFKGETRRPLGLAPQQLVTYVICGLVLVAVALAVSHDGELDPVTTTGLLKPCPTTVRRPCRAHVELRRA